MPTGNVFRIRSLFLSKNKVDLSYIISESRNGAQES